MIDGYQNAALASRLGIPIIYGIDAVHGNNNVYGATIFPHNIGLGATRSDPDSHSLSFGKNSEGLGYSNSAGPIRLELNLSTSI